jgi:hypothetical protein
MKLYRQTARFVLFGLVIASMVFGFQTSAMAGAGPEPGDNCKIPGLKAKYVAPPYVVDMVAAFAGTGTTGTVTLTTTVTSPKNKDCNRTATQVTENYKLADFNAETTKKALNAYCIHNIVTDSSGQYLFCDTAGGSYLEVIAVTEYKRVGNTVTASLIVMEITF